MSSNNEHIDIELLRRYYNNELSEQERWIKDRHASWLRDLQQNNYFQYRLGFLDPEQWDVVEARITQTWSDCDLRTGYFQPDFMESAIVDYLLAIAVPCN